MDTGHNIETRKPCLIQLGMHRFKPLTDGGLYWPARNALIVADLHLEKGSSFARSGQLLPPYDSLATLAQLKSAALLTQPETLILLGDSLHDGGALDRLPDAAWSQLHELAKTCSLVWISGNHDPAPDARLPGTCVESLSLDDVTFRHIPSAQREELEIAGHFHPVARVATSIGSARRKAFISDGSRMILPAYGAYTGGLNALAPEIRSLFDPSGLRAYVCGRSDVFPVGIDTLVPDSRRRQAVKA
jgi:uncharacterized protein